MTKKHISQLADYIEAGEIATHPLLYYDECDSTNRLALDYGLRGGKTGTIILANNQSNGRGRLGKSWHSSPFGGLYFSIILRPKLELAEMSRLTLTAGLALAEAVDLFCEPAAMLKWPNDLLLEGRKCAGILAESDLRQQVPLVIVGIGVNVRQPLTGFAPDIAKRAGSLGMYSSDLGRGEFLHAIIDKFDQQLHRLESGKWLDIRKDWQQRDATLGQRCTWLTAAGDKVTGISAGIDVDGQLFIKDDQGKRHAVLSGDVRIQQKLKNVEK